MDVIAVLCAFLIGCVVSGLTTHVLSKFYYISKYKRPHVGTIMVDHSLENEDPYCFLSLDNTDALDGLVTEGEVTIEHTDILSRREQSNVINS